MTLKGLASIAGLAAIVPQVWAGYTARNVANVAVYWGQNSVGQKGSQDSLGAYCANAADVDIIPVSFLLKLTDPMVNFASAGDLCSTFPGTQLLDCGSTIGNDIKSCQSTHGKTILLSIGGATYSEGGFSSPGAATAAADNIWAMFGPVQSGSNVHRPFGDAVIDGFDFDLESPSSNMVPFAQRLRSHMDEAMAGGGQRFYMSAAPQCVFPDAADNEMLSGDVSFDFVMIQFYNNWCGVINFAPNAAAQNAFNMDVWDNWAKTTSKNKDVKLFLGMPSAPGGGGGFVTGSQLSSVIAFSKRYSSFAGVMLWDMSQLFANQGYLASIVSALGPKGAPGPPPPPYSNGTVVGTRPPTTATQELPQPTAPSTFQTVTTAALPASGSLVAQWGQCGGNDYTGSTQCAPPYRCVPNSAWWAQCQ